MNILTLPQRWVVNTVCNIQHWFERRQKVKKAYLQYEEWKNTPLPEDEFDPLLEQQPFAVYLRNDDYRKYTQDLMNKRYYLHLAGTR